MGEAGQVRDAHRGERTWISSVALAAAPGSALAPAGYLENYTDQLPMITKYHALLGSAHDGLVSAASRRDYAAAAAVLTQDGHLGATYELGGTPFTLTELAATISDVLGTHIAYQNMSVADYTSALTAAGLPPEMAALMDPRHDDGSAIDCPVAYREADRRAEVARLCR